MSKKNFLRFFGTFAGCLFSLAVFSQLQAQSFLSDYFETAASAIPNKISVSAFEEVRYNSNVHDSATRKTGSFINEAGLTLDWYKNLEGLKYGLVGDISYEYYDKESHDLNDFNWTLSPFVLGHIDLLGNDRLMLSLISRSAKEKYDSSDTRHTTHIDNAVGLTYDILKYARWGVAFSARYFNKYYTSSEYKSNSYQQYKFGVAPYYKVSEKIKIGINNSYSERIYRNNKRHDDSKTLEIMPFIDYRASNLFSVHLGIGASRTEYKGESRHTKGNGDWQPAANLTVRYYPVSNFTISYISSFEWEDSGGSRGGRTSFYNSVRATWDLTEKISFSPGLSVDQQDEKNSNYDTTEYSIFANLDYQFSNHVSIYLGYEYEKTEYKHLSSRNYDVNECWMGVKVFY